MDNRERVETTEWTERVVDVEVMDRVTDQVSSRGH